MRSQVICRLGGWFLWASLGALIGAIVVALALPFVATNSQDAGQVMFRVLEGGFAAVAAAFLLGALCHLCEGLARRREGGPRP